MKLRQGPHKSPVGVKFKFSDKHTLPSSFIWELPRVSKCLTGSDGVKEGLLYFAERSEVKSVLCGVGICALGNENL